MRLVQSFRQVVLSTVLAMGSMQASYSQSQIELHHFQSEVQGETVLFNWSVMDASLVRTFEIERAGADFQFETIGTVVVRPTPRSSSIFRLIDQRPLPGPAFYRLKIVDQAGNVQCAKVLSQTVAAATHSSQ